MTEFFGYKVGGVKETLDYFELLAKDQFPFAHSKACNDTAFLIREAEQQKMLEVFDRPKPQTIRNIRLSLGNKKYPGALIFFDQIYEGDEYMVAQVEGGKRAMKRSEQILGHYFVPGVGAQIDQYGNMKGSQITQIISRLKQFQEVGWVMNQNKRTAGRRAQQGNDYFMLTKPTNGLPAGIFQRVDGTEKAGRMQRYMIARSIVKQNKQKGQLKELDQKTKAMLKRGVIPVMIFVKSPPTYKKRFPFFEVANRVVDQNFARVMGEAVDYAVRTAR
jgi:hypothetical protein